MKHWSGPLLLCLLLAIGAHVAVLQALPYRLMDVAMDRLGRDGMVNAWRHGKRATPQSRAVVRPSPDIAYSSCVYDLGKGPVLIQVRPSSGYWSLSLYADTSDNFRVWNDQDSPAGIKILLLGPGAIAPADPGDSIVVHSSSLRGIALTRRLASNALAWQAVDKDRRQDRCGAGS